MSFFSTTANFRHVTPLPAGTDKARAVRVLLRDHAFVVGSGPHAVDCAQVDGAEEAKLAATALASDDKGEHPLPGVVREVVEAVVKSGASTGTATPESSSSGYAGRYAVYRVTDVVHTLPAGLWDSRVVSTYELTDMPAGIYVRIRSPMSIVMDTTWTIKEADDGEPGLVLVEEIVVYCSRLLMTTVKNLCEGAWRGIHAKMVAHLEEKEEKGEKEGK